MYSSLVHYDRIDSVPILRIQKRNLSSPLHVLQVYHCISLSCDKDLDYQHTETVGLWIMGPSNLSLESYLEYQHLYYIIWIDTNSIDICCSIGYIVHTHTSYLLLSIYMSNLIQYRIKFASFEANSQSLSAMADSEICLGSFQRNPQKNNRPLKNGGCCEVHET